MADLSLWLASQKGRCREVEVLSTGQIYQQTLQDALHVAVVNDHADIVSILLRTGVHTDRTYNPMLASLRLDSANALHTLIGSKASVNRRTFWGLCTVAAAGHGAMKCLQVLVMAKADLTLADVNGRTPVMAAAAQGCVGVVHLLVQGKADIDASYNGDTPVLAAARSGHAHVVNLLIQAKADASRCTDYSNASPLLVAAAGGHAAAVRCLLAHAPALAAVATRRESYVMPMKIVAGSTPLDVARLFRHDDVVSLLVAPTANR